jgi:hypothetical protein
MEEADLGPKPHNTHWEDVPKPQCHLAVGYRRPWVSMTISHVLYDKYALASSNVQRHFDLVQSNKGGAGPGFRANE